MHIYYIGRIEPMNTKSWYIKFPGFGGPGSTGLVYQMENFGEAKKISAASRVSGKCLVRTEPPGVPRWSHCGEQKLPSQDWWDKKREESPDDQLANFTALLQTCLPFSVAVLFFRSISLS